MENSVWRNLWICRKTDCVVGEVNIHCQENNLLAKKNFWKKFFFCINEGIFHRRTLSSMYFWSMLGHKGTVGLQDDISKTWFILYLIIGR